MLLLLLLLLPQGVAKFDLTTPPTRKEAAVGTIEYEGRRGGEAFFVPRHQDPAQCDGEEVGSRCGSEEQQM